MPLSNLNTEQKQAAMAKKGYNLVIASAGTGKTSTIVARIAYLLNEGVSPKDIMLLTFTNKAAGEMIQRVGKYFNKNITSSIKAGTFHALSYKILKDLGKNITLKQPKELKMLLKSIYEKRSFHHIGGKSKPYQSTFLYDVYSLFQNKAPNSSLKNFMKDYNEEQVVYCDIYEDIFIEYEEQKKEFGFVDFNDLLILLKNELKNINLSLEEILVDEYQDTNSLQGELIDAFGAKSLFCVGDFDQSIYAFNGANIQIIGSFTKRYKDAQVFSLSKNYRSSKNILNLANEVIKNNPRLYPKNLEVTRVGEFENPKLLVYDELYSQYFDIAKIIQNLNQPFENIAVIFRNNQSADGIEAKLREQGIPSKRKGGISFFDSREIKAIMNLLQIYNNPKDLISFIQIFEYVKGLGSSSSKELYDALCVLGDKDIKQGLLEPKDIKNPFKKKIKNYELGLFDDFLEFGSVGRFYKLGFDENFLSNPILKYAKLNNEGAKFLYELFNLYKKSLRIKNAKSIIQLVSNSYIFNEIKQNLAIKRATLKDGSIDTELKKEALEKIQIKVNLLLEISKNYHDLEKFLNSMTLGSSEMSEGSGVNLLSIHASKGLEFDVVFIIDLMEGRFPNLKLMAKGGSLEEERRLFYVASTRAKNELFLSFAKYDKTKKQNFLPSIFLKEAGFLIT